MTSDQPTNFADCTLAILAGGQGSRMNQPKALLQLGGRPILSHLLDRFQWPGPTLLVTAPGREHPPGGERFTAEAADPASGLGPLRGVLTALEHATTEIVVIAPLDMPGLTRTTFEWLIDKLRQQPSALGMMTRRGNPSAVHADQPTIDRIEPFPSAFRVGAVSIIRKYLEQNRRSVYGLSIEPSIACLAAPAEWDASIWTNLNTPSDVEKFRS